MKTPQNPTAEALIYGKNKTENIVSIEPQDDNAEVFIESGGVVKIGRAHV